MVKKNENKKIRIALAAVLLALTVSGADAYGQNDNFFSTWNEGGDSRTENGASWKDGGFTSAEGGDNPSVPVGGGLLILAASGMCYAGIKRFKKSKI